MTTDRSDRAWREGLLLAFGAYSIWGFMPLLFTNMDGAPVAMILAHRIIWATLLLAVLVSVSGRWNVIRETLRRPRLTKLMGLSALLIASNWVIYILAVQHGHVLQASLGYFINPLVNVLIGLVLLGERMSRWQGAAVLLATLGVLFLAILAGTFPFIALLLAFSFAFYGLVRKIAEIPALEGMMVETALLAPFALGYLLLGAARDPDFADLPRLTEILLVASGPLTALPLMAFAAAAKRMPYSTLGLIQYVAPTLQFLLAIFVLGESFSIAQAISFGFIWAGIALYMFDALRKRP